MNNRILSTIFLLACATAWAGALTPVYLRCEYRIDPWGIDETAPRLSWQVKSDQHRERQNAYQGLVAGSSSALSKEAGIFWDSGKVQSSDTTAIVYRGRALASGQVCAWKVRVWDKEGHVSDWSKPAVWSMGLLDQNEWRGPWIGYDKMRKDATGPAPFVGAKWIWFKGDFFPNFPKGKREFMSELKVPEKARIAGAKLLVAADSRVWFDLNGQAVAMSHSSSKGNARLVDVTPLMKSGANMVRVEVENAQTGPAGLIAQLTVTTTDGQTDTLVTDEKWRATDKGGANWHNRPIGAKEWPACQVIGPASCQPWGDLQIHSTALAAPAVFAEGVCRIQESLARHSLRHRARVGGSPS